MEQIEIEATKYTPKIFLNPDGIISIEGKSYPENSFEFYQPIVEWIDDFLNKSSRDSLSVNMKIIYFNSSSSKVFFDIFDMFEESRDRCKTTIHWIFDTDNENVAEAGEDLKEDFPTLDIRLSAI
jgi:hypothetical protein